MKELKLLSDEARLIVGLDVFVPSRDYVKDPPKDSETIQELGVPPGKLETSIRNWINNTFRRPKGWPLFIAGDLTLTMKWSDFKKKVLTYEAKVKALSDAKVEKPKKNKASKGGKAGKPGAK